MTEDLLKHVDISEELAVFDWRAERWQPEKLTAASPFRDDYHPSFYVYLTDTASAKAGSWGDSGTGERGGFVRLLAALRGEDAEETIDYLREKYGVITDEESGIQRRRFALPSIGKARQQAAEKARVRTLEPPRGERPDYVIERGVSAEVAAESGVVQAAGAVAFPWFDRRGRCRAVKYRGISGKTFWYAKDGENIRDLVYGIEAAEETVAVVEGEIDALYLRTAGVSAVAVGGAAMVNATKTEKIAAAGVREVVVMADHDAAGQRMKRDVAETLRPYGQVAVKVAGYPSRYKDANDIPALDEVRRYVEGARYVRKMKTVSRRTAFRG